MRCLDVTRELAVPTGRLDADEIGRHLASCPRCAKWARRARKLDRLWEATRPEEPVATFDRVWANVCRALDNPVGVDSAPVVSYRSSFLWRLTSAAAASAAVMFVAVVLLFQRGPQINVAQLNQDKHNGQASSVAASEGRTIDTLANVPERIEVEVGQPVMFRMAGREVEVVHLAQNDSSDMVDPHYELFNGLESMAQ